MAPWLGRDAGDLGDLAYFEPLDLAATGAAGIRRRFLCLFAGNRPERGGYRCARVITGSVRGQRGGTSSEKTSRLCSLGCPRCCRIICTSPNWYASTVISVFPLISIMGWNGAKTVCSSKSEVRKPARHRRRSSIWQRYFRTTIAATHFSTTWRSVPLTKATCPCDRANPAETSFFLERGEVSVYLESPDAMRKRIRRTGYRPDSAARRGDIDDDHELHIGR